MPVKKGHPSPRKLEAFSDEHWHCSDCQRLNTELETHCVWCGHKRRSKPK